MPMYQYTFMTWLVANFLHPFAAIFFFSISGSGDSSNEEAGLYFIFGLFFSLPSIVIGCIIIYFISKLRLSAIGKFILWILLISMAPLLNLIFISYAFLKTPFFISDLLLVVPATIAVFFTVLIRAHYFFKIFNKTNLITQPV